MKKHIITILIVALWLLMQPISVHAHVLKTDGGIGAVLHVSPEDDPIVGEPTEFFFEFKDTKEQFAPQNCACVVTIYKAGDVVYTQPLFQDVPNPSLEDASFSYVLPEKNIYTVEVKGEPLQDGSFAPFTLSWDLRVARERATASEASPSSTVLSQYGSFVFALLFVLCLFVLLKYRKRGGDKK